MDDCGNCNVFKCRIADYVYISWEDIEADGAYLRESYEKYGKKEKNVIDVFSIMRNHVKAVLLSTGLKVRRIIWNRGGMFCGPLMR